MNETRSSKSFEAKPPDTTRFSVVEFHLPPNAVGQQIAQLKRRAKSAGIPAIYVNDNFGIWRSDLNRIVSHCSEEKVRGKPFVELVLPDEDDYFVLKPKHSGFYRTTLELLLEHLGATRLILTGIAGNNCVLFTANDAYMRDFEIIVPSDTTVSLTEEDNQHALKQMEKVLKADIRPASELNLERIGAASDESRSDPNKALRTKV